MDSCTFYLGTHQVDWLCKTSVPLFISRRRLASRRGFPRALGSWALDSGGFTELEDAGEWTVGPRQYAAEVRRYAENIGGMAWAAPQDWMCEPAILARTGLSVEEHQRRTVENYLALRNLAPELPWIPVLQGWSQDDYHRCWARYDGLGVDLAALPTVGIGSMCRRQATREAVEIFRSLAPLRLHGFGVKKDGLRNGARWLVSSDSMAWSSHYRRRAPVCEGATHQSCANCLTAALRWRAAVQAMIEPGIRPAETNNRECAFCRNPLPEDARRDARFCKQTCRQKAHRRAKWAEIGQKDAGG